MKLQELARLVDGELVGNGQTEIKSVCPISEAAPGSLIFVLEKKHLADALASRAAAVLAEENSVFSGKPGILCKNPRRAMAKILARFAPRPGPLKGVHKTAIIPPSCKIGKNVYVGPYAVLGEGVKIGDNTQVFPHSFIGERSELGKNCVINPHVTLYPRTKIGAGVIIHSGARVGVEGFGFFQEGGKHVKIPQIGNVVIEDGVEIFGNVTIARATMGSTIIGAGTKIDCLTHVAHNCRLGADCAVVSLVGFAGSVTLGDRVYVAGQAGFKGHQTVGENSIIMARAGVTKDFPPNSVISGFPAQEHRVELAMQAELHRLSQKHKK